VNAHTFGVTTLTLLNIYTHSFEVHGLHEASTQ
jgi:hypothetical protein